MSIPANMDWEIRTDGSPTNGGGFTDRNPGTSVDYSQQAAAQLALTDIASDGAGTGITSATGGFTAAMEGNVIFITGGTGFTQGWYQITGYTDTNTITIDRTCVANKTGGTGNVGGAWKFADTYAYGFFASPNKGSYNTVWVKAGTYVSCWDATYIRLDADYNRMVGYNTSRGDCPEGTNRPFFDLGTDATYFYITAAHQWMSNIRMDSQNTASTACIYSTSTSINFILRNCKIVRAGHTSAFGIRSAAAFCKIIQCEVTAPLATAIRVEDFNCLVAFSYIHDSNYGIVDSGTSSYACTVENCVIDTITINGLSFYYGATAKENTIYNCGTGIITSSLYNTFFNNIVHTCTTGINSPEYTYDDNNCFYNNTTERTGGVVAGPNNITSDPKLAAPAIGDFTLDAGSPCFNIGIKLGAAVGL